MHLHIRARMHFIIYYRYRTVRTHICIYMRVGTFYRNKPNSARLLMHGTINSRFISLTFCPLAPCVRSHFRIAGHLIVFILRKIKRDVRIEQVRRLNIQLLVAART